MKEKQQRIKDLKAFAYDCLAIIESHQAKLQQANQEIGRLNRELQQEQDEAEEEEDIAEDKKED